MEGLVLLVLGVAAPASVHLFALIGAVLAMAFEVVLALAPAPSLGWMADGHVSAQVTDLWRLDTVEIDMDWRVAFTGPDLAAPPGAGPRERLAAAAAGRVVAARDGALDLGFRLQLDETALHTGATGDLRALGRELAAALAIPVRALPASPDGDAPGLLDRLRDAVGRPRDPGD
jgi:hypothetical protein